MLKQQVFKVKGMQRDASLANANGDFAYEIVNMRLMPSEEESGFSLTNEKGTTKLTNCNILGTVIGQCPTNDSLVIFTTEVSGTSQIDRIYELSLEYSTWSLQTLFQGNLGFDTEYHIEAIFNYETEDIQKVYWIDSINQLRCINIVESPTNWGMAKSEGATDWTPTENINNQYFDSIKEINSIPSVEIERVSGGSFTAGVLQYYITYFNEFMSESPIVYTSPLLYTAHDSRGSEVNTIVTTSFKLRISSLDRFNWKYIRIYATHRSSLDATPEGSIVTEIQIPETSTIEFTDYGSNRTSITPTDLYFKGGKWVKAGTMTVKDQVMFLGNLNTESDSSLKYTEIKSLFDSLRESENIDNFFSTVTRKQRENKLSEYENINYYYKNQLNNTKSITHYKYGEKYRFGISLMDKYGVWSNPIWIKDAFIIVPPEQVDSETLELPCPSLDLNGILDNGKTLWEELQSYGVVAIKPLVVFPNEAERKVIAQGVVCPTVYNLKDRKENGPYAQASWFMRPNVPVDLWGFTGDKLGKEESSIFMASPNDDEEIVKVSLSHKNDLRVIEYKVDGNNMVGYYGAGDIVPLNNGLSPFNYVHDDFSLEPTITAGDSANWKAGYVYTFLDSSTGLYRFGGYERNITHEEQKEVYNKGNWVEFRHNYALRTKGDSFGVITPKASWPVAEDSSYSLWGMVRGAELEVSDVRASAHVNRFHENKSEDTIKISVFNNWYNVYFCTLVSPKTIDGYKRKRAFPVYLIYIYTDQYNKQSVHVFQTVNMYRDTRAGDQVNIQADRFASMTLRLKNWESNPVKLKVNDVDAGYYVWQVRDISEYSKDVFVRLNCPDYIYIDLNKDAKSDLIYLDKDLSEINVGNSAYYIDNSIVTLNSPEIELNKDSQMPLSDADFRIIGMIPLTATASDSSLQVNTPGNNPLQLQTGFHKREFYNKNIDPLGFRGIVGSNGYFSSFGELASEHAMTSVHPWQSSSTLGYYVSSDSAFGSKDILKRKIISNLRYSANSYYFGVDNLYFKENDNSYYQDTAFLDQSKVMGWKPCNGCFIDTFTGDTATSMLKLFDLGYSVNALTYKGNIDSIATPTVGVEYSPDEIPTYVFGRNAGEQSSIDNSIERIINSPASSNINISRRKTSGASIRYKSSPHYVIGFNTIPALSGFTKVTQETLPAWGGLNEEGIPYFTNKKNVTLDEGRLYEDSTVTSIFHQNYIGIPKDKSLQLGLPSFQPSREGKLFEGIPTRLEYSMSTDTIHANQSTEDNTGSYIDFGYSHTWWPSSNFKENVVSKLLDDGSLEITITHTGKDNNVGSITDSTLELTAIIPKTSYDTIIQNVLNGNIGTSFKVYSININFKTSTTEERGGDNCEGYIEAISQGDTSVFKYFNLMLKHETGTIDTEKFNIHLNNLSLLRLIIHGSEFSLVNLPNYGWLWLGEIYRETDPTYGGETDFALQNNQWETGGNSTNTGTILSWTQGDTYYQRFDTLKTFALNDSDQNSVIDITSFMVETHINIDGRYDRNRGQESNLQMSPTNFNLMNDVYSQRDNFFTYRILDDNGQARTNFPQQITWSLSKTAGEAVDAWMNVTLASVLDLDGTKGKLTALKIFNNNIVAFQESGLSQILFNSRVQIPTSEAVPIQIANSGKVDGQQYFTQDVGCQDKLNIVTTPNGLYFVDYYNKSIYKFNGQLEELTAANGFRGWCNKYINENSTIIGYYDVKNKEVMYYDSNFRANELPDTSVWLGFSELANAFSSFYTYPKAILSTVKGNSVWLYNNYAYTHQTGNYNDLLGTSNPYGLTVIPRQDSNVFKTFYNVEFRADSYRGNSIDNNNTFNTITAETEYQAYTPNTLTYNKYIPSNLKKKFRTWRANIPRVNNSYERFSNQWAKIGLWKKNIGSGANNIGNEKTILHDMSVIYGE